MLGLRRIWGRVRQRRATGELWPDRPDGAAVVTRGLAEGTLRPDEARALTHWIEEGYWILPRAIDPHRMDAVVSEMDGIWDSARPRVLVELGGRIEEYRRELRDEHCKLVDLYARVASVLEVAMSRPVVAFLERIFEAPPLLFQSLSFERGSEQDAHQDVAYVVVTPPLRLAAAWIALEDVRPGSGELFYYPRSHRLGDHRFRGGFRHWNRGRDGGAGQERYGRWLARRLEERGLERKVFLPAKGDVLIWSAGLVHGGMPIRDRSATRKSLVCHYCPSDARPYYLNHVSRRRPTPHRFGGSWISAHYEPGAAGS